MTSLTYGTPSRQPDHAGTTPTVSFIIPCYNGRRYLEECLQSIARLDDPSCEALVVDDGSTEDIQEVVARYSFARYLRQPNQGPAAARNNGLRHAAAPYVRFLDADDYLLPTPALEEQVRLLDNHPEVGLVYGQAVTVDTRGRPFGVRKPPFARGSYVRAGEAELNDLLLGNYVTTSTTLVRRYVVTQVGGFREHLFGPEDWDCWLRIAQVAAIAYVAAPIVGYRVHEKSVTAGYRLDPWLRMHTDILDAFFSVPGHAQRYAALRPMADAHLYATAAMLAYSNAQMGLTRRYARRALAQVGWRRQRRMVATCLWLVAKSAVPTALRRPLRQAGRRVRRAVMAAHLAPR